MRHLAHVATIGRMEAVGGLVLLAIILAWYFVPSLAAKGRNAPNVGSIVVINLLLGWTFIGWVVALAMAFRDPKPATN